MIFFLEKSGTTKGGGGNRNREKSKTTKGVSNTCMWIKFGRFLKSFDLIVRYFEFDTIMLI